MKQLVQGLLACLLLSSCSVRDGFIRWEDLGVDEAPVRVDDERAPDPPAPPPPPPAPAVIASSSARVMLEGKHVSDGDVVAMPALELVCIADPRALTEPSRAKARFDEVAKKEGVTVGALEFVRLLRDPSRSVVDPPPRLCRTLAAPAELKAPLERELEPASRWLVVQIRTSLPEDAARVAQLARDKSHAPTATPRVLLDDQGKPVGVAIPGGA